MAASLSFASAKYDARSGRASLLAALLKEKFEFTTIKDQAKVVFASVMIDDKKVLLNETSKIETALQSNATVVLVTASGYPYNLSAIEKQGVFQSTAAGFNAGDVAEGIFAIALFARFVSKATDIYEADLLAIQKKIKRLTPQSSFLMMPSKNKNPDVTDTINLTINLAKTNLDAALDSKTFKALSSITSASLSFCNSKNVSEWANLFYTNNKENTINIISDGIGDQKGTKMDVKVTATDKKGKEIDIGMNYSLKAGDVKQFGQIGGSEFEKQVKLWAMFGIDVNSIEKKYNELLGHEPLAALKLSYSTGAAKFNTKPNNGAILKDVISKQMIGEEDIVLVQLNKVAHLYNPKLLIFTDKIVATIKHDGATPRIQFNSKQGLVMEIRAKVERGTYFRNYFEKGKDLSKHLPHV